MNFLSLEECIEDHRCSHDCSVAGMTGCDDDDNIVQWGRVFCVFSVRMGCL